MSWLIWQLLKKTAFWLSGPRRKERHQLDPRVLSHRGIVWCKLIHLNFLKRPLSKGDGLSGLCSSRVLSNPLLHSRMAQGQILSSYFIQGMQTVTFTVGVPIILLENVRKPDGPIKVKILVRTIKTRARSRPLRSNKGRLISPCFQSFLKEHR